MAERITAGEQLARILQLLPHAVRKDGASLDELASLTGATTDEVVRDLEEVYTRAFYQPAGSPDDVQIAIDARRVNVWTTGDFRRPVRFGPRESIATVLALRAMALADTESSDAMHALADRLEGSLLDHQASGEAKHFGLNPAALTPGGPYEVLAAAARERFSCSIMYLKSGATEPQNRLIDPYSIVSAGGKWYVVGRCHRHQDVRVFRLDRILTADGVGAAFEIPLDFDPEEYVAEGRVFRGEDLELATVRYSPGIARRIAEFGPVTTLDDGSVLVRYAVADRDWLVRHLLEHGSDAVVLDPPEMRELVVKTVQAFLSHATDEDGSAG